MYLAKKPVGNTNSASGDILEAFGRLGKSVNVRVDDFPMFERYLLNLHCKKGTPWHTYIS